MQGLELLPETAWLWQGAEQVVTWNQQGREYLGLHVASVHHAGGFFLAAFVDDRDLDLAARSWTEAHASGSTWEVELRLTAADGSQRWHLVRGRAMQPDEEDEECWLGTCTDIHALKTRQLEALEREQHYHTLMQNSSQSIWRFALDEPLDRTWSVERQLEHLYKHGYLADCNMTMARTYGFNSPAEMLGTRLADVVPPREPANIAFLTHAIQSGYRVVDQESVEVDRHGNELHFLNSFVASEEQIWSAWGTSHDITGRVRVEKALRESEQRSQRATEMGRVGIWELDLIAGTFYIAPQLNAMLGYANGELDNHVETWSRLVHPDDFERVRLAAVEHLEGRAPMFEAEARRRHKDGHYLWFLSRGTAERNEAGVPVKLIGADMDITAHKTTQEALKDSERMLSLIYHHSSDCLYLMEVRHGTGYRIVSANETFLKVSGYTRDQVKCRDMEELLPPENRARAMAKHDEAVQSRRPVVFEETADLPAGRRHAEVTLIPIADAEGTVTHLLGCVKDMTSHKETEEALQKARDTAEAASNSKDRFLAVLSHELRTPLTPVLLTVSALEDDPSLPAVVREDLAMVRRNVELETKLIDDLLDLSRITSGKLRLKPAPSDLNDLVNHVLETCASQLMEKDIGIHQEFHSGALPVNADQARLQQALWNVLKNAIKFSPEGGDIFVKTSLTDTGASRVEVRDTGIGIDRAQISLIFDAFHQGGAQITREFGGLGLGLAISKAVVELHQGRIWAESDGHLRGATIIMEFPSCDGASVGVVSPPSEAVPVAPRMTLLLVEDHLDTANTLARLLRTRGYGVILATSVTEALEAAATQPFDLLVSDIGLPDATGYDLMHRLRMTRPVKGIAMSGYGMEEDVLKGREAGFSEHLVKPVKLAALMEAITRVMAQPTPAEPRSVA